MQNVMLLEVSTKSLKLRLSQLFVSKIMVVLPEVSTTRKIEFNCRLHKETPENSRGEHEELVKHIYRFFFFKKKRAVCTAGTMKCTGAHCENPCGVYCCCWWWWRCWCGRDINMRVSVQAHAKVHLILGAMFLWTRVQGPNYYPRRRHRRHNAASTSAL